MKAGKFHIVMSIIYGVIGGYAHVTYTKEDEDASQKGALTVELYCSNGAINDAVDSSHGSTDEGVGIVEGSQLLGEQGVVVAEIPQMASAKSQGYLVRFLSFLRDLLPEDTWSNRGITVMVVSAGVWLRLNNNEKRRLRGELRDMTAERDQRGAVLERSQREHQETQGLLERQQAAVREERDVHHRELERAAEVLTKGLSVRDAHHEEKLRALIAKSAKEMEVAIQSSEQALAEAQGMHEHEVEVLQEQYVVTERGLNEEYNQRLQTTYHEATASYRNELERAEKLEAELATEQEERGVLETDYKQERETHSHQLEKLREKNAELRQKLDAEGKGEPRGGRFSWLGWG